MRRLLVGLVDWFIPEKIRKDDNDLLMARTFVALHLAGPLAAHSVTIFLRESVAGRTWMFWLIEAMVLSFLAVPLILKASGSLRLAASFSVQTLVGISLFGSFFFGGMASPLLPWFLIAMTLGFFYLAESVLPVLVGVGLQLSAFVAARVWYGEFPSVLDPAGLHLANTFSIITALLYMTVLTLYYEKVMRISLRLEQQTVDERRKLDELRVAMEAAELASKRKSIFLAKMNHELRTPLNAVIGYAEILRESFEDAGGAERKMEDLDRIHAAGRHLLALVNNVIDLSSIESHPNDIKTESVDVRSLISEVVASASPLAHKRDNKLIVQVDPSLGEVELDPLKVRQSILNLLSNSAKFTSKGTIVLEVKRLEQDDVCRLVISVSDTGIGMTEDGLSRIFGNFSQAERDTVTKFGGSGLGLALTRQFCEMMGGQISVRSARGLGTTFTIDLPLIEAARPVLANAA